MKIIFKHSRSYVIRFERGELWPEVFLVFCRAQGVRSAFFYGLGGFIDPEVAYYDLKRTRQYASKRLKGVFEVLTLTGNAAFLDGRFVVHCHVVLGRKDYAAVGGHLVSARIGGTLELYVHTLGSKIIRKKDKKTGLKLLESGI
ncbi:MAG: hypothetical protein A3J67_00325 [Parcubacteria group bacterium RIFCSPHIGHO2_02_FULL_48_10b]|nr:MAG: hypothetical protein A3J67_00325 [Parcubacteria group bacterium RIFCSPHIGHO2_02_FULL_48_10b]